MRRSKSNPAKYARNYRKISQRHMTGGGDDGSSNNNKGRLDEEAKEKKRLESILLQSEQTWKRGLAEKSGRKDDEKKISSPTDANNNNNNKADNTFAGTQPDECGDDMLSLLSPELRAQFSGMGDNTLLILPSKKKKPKTTQTKALPPLTPEEIKAAKTMYKNTQRKLQQLEHRRQQKELRSGLYKQLEEHTLLQQQKPQHLALTNNEEGGAGRSASTAGADNCNNASSRNTTALPTISSQQAQSLLLKSSELGKKQTKKERLKQLRRKEALGIQLTQEEIDLLYVKYDAPALESFPGLALVGGGSSIDDANNDGDGERGSVAKKRRKNKVKRKREDDYDADDQQVEDKKSGSDEFDCSIGREGDHEQSGSGSTTTELPASHMDAQEKIINHASSPSIENSAATSINGDEPKETKPNFSQMMFASLTSLKTKTDTRNQELATEMATKQAEEEDMVAKLEAEERKKRKVYVPTEVPTVSTIHLIGKDVISENADKELNNAPDTEKRIVAMHIHRPVSIEASRYDLPVSAMEYEIIDAVRSNDCTILCSETGSGKSTQVPQFLYEAGFSTSDWWQRQQHTHGSGKCKDKESNPLIIGITQPRRVAAVSTAKRVCYEMGRGDGQSISSNNLVAYQTRYETAGLGPSTRVKFMTDGILLQEIQSDLLLRKYGAIVIDEAHERNLNTDVLLGLLSLALPLRRRAAEEGSLPPLKLVVMSATLRVEDFTNNSRLFPVGEDGVQHKPALVTITGRTHPVSIHHSKVTELDNYGEICVAMHRTQFEIAAFSILNFFFIISRCSAALPQKKRRWIRCAKFIANYPRVGFSSSLQGNRRLFDV
jgi:HrpA-like RNA helicase